MKEAGEHLEANKFPDGAKNGIPRKPMDLVGNSPAELNCGFFSTMWANQNAYDAADPTADGRRDYRLVSPSY